MTSMALWCMVLATALASLSSGVSGQGHKCFHCNLNWKGSDPTGGQFSKGHYGSEGDKCDNPPDSYTMGQCVGAQSKCFVRRGEVEGTKIWVRSCGPLEGTTPDKNCLVEGTVETCFCEGEKCNTNSCVCKGGSGLTPGGEETTIGGGEGGNATGDPGETIGAGQLTSCTLFALGVTALVLNTAFY